MSLLVKTRMNEDPIIVEQQLTDASGHDDNNPDSQNRIRGFQIIFSPGKIHTLLHEFLSY